MSIEARYEKIWDRLAEFPASDCEEALRYLLGATCELLQVQHAVWIAATRLPHFEEDDATDGWRPRNYVAFNEAPVTRSLHEKGRRDFDRGKVPESTRHYLDGVGEFRVLTLRETVSDAFYSTAHYRDFYQARGFRDALYVAAPVSADAEACYIFHQTDDDPAFTTQSKAIAWRVLRGLRWFNRQVFLGSGLMVAREPVTPTELKILRLLQTDLPEKNIADRMNQSPATTHQHVKSLYRKFGVRSRHALMALLLNHL